MSSSKKPSGSHAEHRTDDDKVVLEVDPGFIYKVYAYNPDDLNECICVGYLFRDENFNQECWSMKAAWEGGAQSWAKKPGGPTSDQSKWRSTIIKLMPVQSSTVNNVNYPTGSTEEARADQFFTSFPAGTDGKQYKHSIITVR